MKTGKLSKSEREFILANAEKMTPVTVANRLNRSPELIAKFLKENFRGTLAVDDGDGVAPGPVTAERLSIKVELHGSMAWKQLAEEFLPEEVKYFEEQYVALKEQFKDDVMASEERTLFKVIKSEILMHRNLVQQRRSQEEIERLEAERESLLERRKLHKDDDDLENSLLNNDTMLTQAYASKQSRSNEYDKLDRSHSEIMKSLKATREQRIARIEGNKRSLIDIIRMLNEKEAAERADRQIDQIRKQSSKELRRLGAPHQYADLTMDRPILNCETVGLSEDEDVTVP